MVYYPFAFVINNTEYFSLWYSDEVNGFLTKSGQILLFKDIDELRRYAKNHDLEISEEQTSALNVDEAIKWLSEDNKFKLDCNYFSEFWNTASDLAASIGESFYGDRDNTLTNKVYDKLFWGCNLPSVTPENKEYLPKWDSCEIEELTRVLQHGVGIIEKAVR